MEVEVPCFKVIVYSIEEKDDKGTVSTVLAVFTLITALEYSLVVKYFTLDASFLKKSLPSA
jgi:hypothetical protein